MYAVGGDLLQVSDELFMDMASNGCTKVCLPYIAKAVGWQLPKALRFASSGQNP